MTFGPVQPLGDLSTIIGQRGRDVSLFVRAFFWICLMLSMAFSMAVAMSSCIFSGSSPSTKRGVQPQPRKNCSSSSGSIRERIVGLLILYPLRCRIGSTAPSVTGSSILVGLPGGRQRARLRFTVANNTRDNRPKSMTERIAQFAALVDRARRRRCNMTGDSAGKRELLEELLQSGLVESYIGINLAPGAFEVDIAHNRWPAMTGTGHVKHVEVVLLDNPVQMDVDEVLTRVVPSARPRAASRGIASVVL